MWRGMLRRAKPRGAVTTLTHGGCTFAEHPVRAAPEARLIWHANYDPGTVSVSAFPADPGDPDSFQVNDLAPWLTGTTDEEGREHVVLSDGWRHVRIDVEEGRFLGEDAVLLQYRLTGIASAEPGALTIRRIIDLCRRRRFTKNLFPPDRHMARGLDALRVHDALMDGASQREIGAVLFGQRRIALDWSGTSDSLRSRVRRLVSEARAMARGHYRQLMQRSRRLR